MRSDMFSQLFLILLLSICCKMSDVVAANSSKCLEDQKMLLLQLRNNLTCDSEISTKLVKWNQRIDCCQWEGVTCNSEGQVIGLDLSAESFSGSINLLANLKFLSIVRLDGNNLSAPIPEFFAELTNLTVLSLSSCNLIGEAPQKIFQVPTLQTIDLSENEMLGGSLPEFPSKGSLQNLVLSDTKFSGSLPESIGNLRKLSRIELRACNFTGPIPSSMENLTQLVLLDFELNSFTGSFPSFKLSKNLTRIYSARNRLTGISSDWQGFENLKYLDLSNNSISGLIPASVFYLPSLSDLVLSNNMFSGQITELQNVISPLTSLELSSNKLEGPIPEFLFELHDLYGLSLSFNKFNGTVQLKKFTNLNKLVSLDLSHNSLSVDTTISESDLALLPQLNSFMLASCNLQNISFLKNQSKLSMLDLSNNQLTGEIPNWLVEINDGLLRFLNLSFNQFMRLQEPYTIGFLMNFLDLHSNLLTGVIPLPPRAAAYIDFSDNNFSSFPPDFGKYLVTARFLSIANNKVIDAPSEPEVEVDEFISRTEIYVSAILGFVVGIGIIFLPLLFSKRWNQSYNRIIDRFILRIFQQQDQERRTSSSIQMRSEMFSQLFLILLLSICCKTSDVVAADSSKCLEDQKMLLLQLRNKLTYYPEISTKLVKWNQRIDCCQWEGVTCNSAGQVIGLDLSAESFSGSINLLANLKFLSIVRLDGNNLSAPIPEFFAELTNLTVLSLSSCNLIGEAPQKIFQVPTLQTIDLSVNEMLGGSLPEFPSKGSLQNLALSYTKFSGSLPESIGNLSKLSRVELRACNFTGPIPSSMENLTQLVLLDFNLNSFTGSFPSFKLSKNLTDIYSARNRLTGISSDWEGFENLKYLDLSNNSISGLIPESLFYLPSLSALFLSNNMFSGQITELQNVISPLESLELSSNKLEGPIPEFLFELHDLYGLSLSFNKFNGTVQLKKFTNLNKLVSLDLSHNSLSVDTNISESDLALLPQLNSFMLASCNLQNISFLKNQSKLSMLDLSNSQLTGEIPNWLVEINDGLLRFLNLSFNQFTHLQEPYTFGFLNFLDLHSNLLTGVIPLPPRAAAYIDFSNNNFSTFPPDFGNYLVTARFLSIANNKVIGGVLPRGSFLELKGMMADPSLTHSRSDILHFESQSVRSVYYQDRVTLSHKGQDNNSADAPSEPEVEEDEFISRTEIYVSAILGFVVGVGIIFLPLLFSKRWSQSYNRTIDRLILRIFQQQNQERRTSSSSVASWKKASGKARGRH
ncbi:hypothetical protein H5410_011424 [Solanum commersonii]|uniref:Leucine-rich repeat-containing N-terminal plant-type domain-containing protein n=1 Tax=Solanum commersonii TaxID=4109 RepID=A0A9J6ANM6_SOLCO|nr:hypothetical protein H5410_011424 [Solanum commersonii]